MKPIKQIRDILVYINNHPLAGRHKLRAFYKFISWQIHSRITTDPITVPFTEKTYLLVKKGMAGATGNIYTGLHEFEDMAFLLHFLNTEDLFLDIGANIGSYTILASGHKAAASIAFEPVPSTFHSLEKNIRLNSLEHKVKAMNVGVGAKHERRKFTTNMDSANHVSIQTEGVDNENTVDTTMVTVDEIVAKEICPLMIKIDVEGFESEVLKGMTNTLGDNGLKAVLIELNGCGERYGYKENDIHELFIKNGFKPYSYEPFERKINLLETYGKFNTLYLRDVDFIKNRILLSDKVNIFSESF